MWEGFQMLTTETTSGGILIPNFCNLSTVASRFYIASHSMSLYLGCILGCSAKCFQGTLGWTGNRDTYILWIENLFPSWACPSWCCHDPGLFNLFISWSLDANTFLTTHEAPLGIWMEATSPCLMELGVAKLNPNHPTRPTRSCLGWVLTQPIY